MRSKEEILPHEGAEALAQAAQRSCGCPLPGRAQGQAGWGWEHPGLVEGVPARGRGLGLGGLSGPFPPKPFYEYKLESPAPASRGTAAVKAGVVSAPRGQRRPGTETRKWPSVSWVRFAPDHKNSAAPSSWGNINGPVGRQSWVCVKALMLEVF